MRVALVHYWLVGMRGGEKVIESLCRLYPNADIFTHVYDPAAVSETIRRHRVTTTFIARLPFSKRWYPLYLRLMPMALDQLDLRAYDLVISSEAGPAKGIRTHPDTLHVCYCHSPMRYLWDQYETYREQSGLLGRVGLALVAPALRRWDVLSSMRVDQFVANSRFVSRRIEKTYRREAPVIHPPVDTDAFWLPTKPRADFYLCVGQLVPYKRIDLAIAACRVLGRRLVVVGSGPQRRQLEKMAGKHVEFLGWTSAERVGELYRSCRALIFPGEEDFGIVPVEAMACGTPVIAQRGGGTGETVVPGVAGILFDRPDVDSLVNAIRSFEQFGGAMAAEPIRARALEFSRQAFEARFSHLIDAMMRGRPGYGPASDPISRTDEVAQRPA